MRRGRTLLAAALLGLLTGCGGSAATSTELAGTRLDPPFEVSSTPLVDTEGAAYSLTEDTDKDLTLVFFGYTHCPDICGQVMATLAGAMTRLPDSARDQVDVVFITTDPARDDEEAVAAYTAQFDEDFIGLTGDLDDIVALGKSVAVGVDQGEELASGGYEVTHGTQVIAVDSSDQAPVYWRADVSQAQLAADVLTLLDEG